jgi:drug/metabolite transporter (DMT)-like permease
LFLLSGFGIFASQAFYIIGIKLSSAVAASVWQPSQPLITASVCMLMGWEPVNVHRCIGIMIAFVGCAIMVAGGSGSGGEAIGGESDVKAGAFANVVGQLSFLLNCCGTSLYVLSSKTIIATGRYESVTITAWSYVVGSIMMGVFSFVLSWSKGISTFLCSDCHEGIWHVPLSAIPAMLWFIVMTSSVAYGLITWANKYATGTLVIGYSVMQPVASAILIQFLISMGIYDGCEDGNRESNRVLKGLIKPCLDEPDKFTIIGAIGVFIGLAVVIFTEPKKSEDVLSETDDADQIFELAERQGFLSAYDDSLVE